MLVILGKVFTVCYDDQAAGRADNILRGKNNRLMVDGRNYVVIQVTVDNEDVTVGDEVDNEDVTVADDDDSNDSYNQDNVKNMDDQAVKCKGQQSIKSYFRAEKRRTITKKMTSLETMTKPRTSDVVTSDEGRRQMIMVGNDVEALFPSMTDKNTGTAVCKQVKKSPMVVKGADYMEMTRYIDICVVTCLRWRISYPGEGKLEKEE
jgi:hypothetical protein